MTAIRLLSLASVRPTPSLCASRHVLRRTQATVASGEPTATATNRAQATLKRFWKTVGIETQVNEHGGEHLAVMLDKRALKTPSGNPLLVPREKALTATLVAAEWDNQETQLKQHSLPMTSLVSRAIDAFQNSSNETRLEVHEQLLRYLETDTVCFHAEDPPSLVKQQEMYWEPLLAWARDTYDVKINVTTGFSLKPHPKTTLSTFREVLKDMNEWEIAAMERATYTSKSFLIALALVKKHISVDYAAQLAHVEVNSQIKTWGEVEDTHDVDYHDVRRQLGSAACILANHQA
ncbi:hypothetical protein PHLGIDRAFT_29802 [Phlebiopsis gigantea 11061_1 CR5-6]|uniref:ATP12-domain-containing protein n=1 Tax=Phlebiopsis gigantea (strain 11061_1 CR5-6) TaxID=745531 RepID=A0A0C3NS00_PHLG1|nr:hypothetical protein PHLGIDRAFT_29802 [Phlebiopsis gigantea 11061_1 CR5-6]